MCVVDKTYQVEIIKVLKQTHVHSCGSSLYLIIFWLHSLPTSLPHTVIPPPLSNSSKRHHHHSSLLFLIRPCLTHQPLQRITQNIESDSLSTDFLFSALFLLSREKESRERRRHLSFAFHLFIYTSCAHLYCCIEWQRSGAF